MGFDTRVTQFLASVIPFLESLAEANIRVEQRLDRIEALVAAKAPPARMTEAQVEERYNAPRRKVANARRAGLLKAVKVSKSWVYAPDDIEAWLSTLESKPRLKVAKPAAEESIEEIYERLSRSA